MKLRGRLVEIKFKWGSPSLLSPQTKWKWYNLVPQVFTMLCRCLSMWIGRCSSLLQQFLHVYFCFEFYCFLFIALQFSHTLTPFPIPNAIHGFCAKRLDVGQITNVFEMDMTILHVLSHNHRCRSALSQSAGGQCRWIVIMYVYSRWSPLSKARRYFFPMSCIWS